MRFMMFVRANKNIETGALPTKELVAAMGRFNAEMMKAGVLLAAEGLQPSSKGGAHHVLASDAQRDGRAVPRQGAGLRLLDDPGEVEERGGRMGQARALRGRRGGDSSGVRDV